MTGSISLFEDVVTITERYVGPPARRFITRQVAFHLNKSPEDLVPSDIPRLVEWTRATLALLTDDKELVESCAREIIRLEVSE